MHACPGKGEPACALQAVCRKLGQLHAWKCNRVSTVAVMILCKHGCRALSICQQLLLSRIQHDTQRCISGTNRIGCNPKKHEHAGTGLHPAEPGKHQQTLLRCCCLIVLHAQHQCMQRFCLPERGSSEEVPCMSGNEVPSSGASGTGLMLAGCSLLGEGRLLRWGLVCHGGCAPQP